MWTQAILYFIYYPCFKEEGMHFFILKYFMYTLYVLNIAMYTLFIIIIYVDTSYF